MKQAAVGGTQSKEIRFSIKTKDVVVGKKPLAYGYIIFGALFFLFPSAKTCLCVRKKGSQARQYAPGPSISTYQIGVA